MTVAQKDWHPRIREENADDEKAAEKILHNILNVGSNAKARSQVNTEENKNIEPKKLSYNLI